MKRKRNRKYEKTEFSLSAMIDVVFLLLLFFIATFQAQKVEAHLAISHPGGIGPGGLKLEARIMPKGYEIMGRPATLTEVEQALSKYKVQDPAFPVLIKVSPSATEGQLVTFLDLCGKLKMTNLNVLTLKE